MLRAEDPDSPSKLSTISPPRQGDALSGLTIAIAGVGPAGAPKLPKESWPGTVFESDAWSIAIDAETGWYVLLSQDCDVVRSPADEPTVLIAPLVSVSEQEWRDLNHNHYSSRRFAYPSEKLGLHDQWVAVDLGWSTSVTKGSLRAKGVEVVRPLTGPQREMFTEWLAARLGRAAFGDDVVEFALDPCYFVRQRLLKRFHKAVESGGTAPLEARAVAAVARWYVRVDGRLVHILGELTGASLQRSGLVDSDGAVKTIDLRNGQERLQAEIVKRMVKVASTSGFELKVQLADLAHVRASQFREFALLVR